MMARWLSGVVVAGLAAAVILAGGCGRALRPQHVEITGIKLPPQYPATVEVDNFNGSVFVVADPEVAAAQVRARPRATSKNAPKVGQLPEAISVTATASIEGPERILRVVGRPADNPPKDVAIDLFIRVPKINATRIKNAGGAVEIVRVGGSVHVENGVGGGAGGDIQVRTGEPMTEPSSLTTSSGRVLWQVGPDSTGKFDLISDSGQAKFTCRLGVVSEMVPDANHTRGRLNSGTNLIALRSGAGPVEALVIENAATYGPQRWDGTAPAWPQRPRIIGRLGGYHNEQPAKLLPEWIRPRKSYDQPTSQP